MESMPYILAEGEKKMKIIKVNCKDEKQVPVKSLKKGDYFTLKQIDEPKQSQVWVMQGWDRYSRVYYATKFSDMNQSKEFKGTEKVFIDFYF